MVVVLVYNCTVAKRSPLLCENFNLLSFLYAEGSRLARPGPPRFTVDHTLTSRRSEPAIVLVMKVISNYQVSTKSWPAL
jgi:hypothetical protein